MDTDYKAAANYRHCNLEGMDSKGAGKVIENKGVVDNMVITFIIANGKSEEVVVFNRVRAEVNRADVKRAEVIQYFAE